MNEVNERMGHVGVDPEVGFSSENASALVKGTKARASSALALYRQAEAADMLSSIRQASYRCARGCLLLDVFDTPVGPASFKPAFRLSPQRNSASDKVARSELTSDGERRWEASADLLLPVGLEYWVNCDHLLNHVLTGEQVRSDVAVAARGKVLIVK